MNKFDKIAAEKLIKIGLNAQELADRFKSAFSFGSTARDFSDRSNQVIDLYCKKVWSGEAVKAAPEHHGTEEGSRCTRDGCDGELELIRSEGCSCHISPPCSSCVEARPGCNKCGWNLSDDD